MFRVISRLSHQQQQFHLQQKRFKVLLRNRKTNKKSIGTFVEVQEAKKPTCIWQSGNPSLLLPLPGIVFDEESLPKYVYNTTLQYSHQLLLTCIPKAGPWSFWVSVKLTTFTISSSLFRLAAWSRIIRWRISIGFGLKSGASGRKCISFVCWVKKS